MKFSIERAALLKAVAQAQSVVERRNTIPILSNVLIHADSAGLRLTATDLDVEIVETVPADVSQPGGTTARVWIEGLPGSDAVAALLLDELART